ncbi:MAG: hypothetical protein HQM10_05035 [Candidatus Riflebacteria bacterium]|nr:hypothetical protein [Candidatus Riflebacteria bacterium]
MALRKTILRSENRVGGLFSNGYFRILESNVDRRNNKWRIRVGGFADEEARRLASNQPNMMGEDQRIVSDKWYEAPVTNSTSIADAYAYLKTQPDFATAADVLEEGQEA